jgi:hypothetical protein
MTALGRSFCDVVLIFAIVAALDFLLPNCPRRGLHGSG